MVAAWEGSKRSGKGGHLSHTLASSKQRNTSHRCHSHCHSYGSGMADLSALKHLSKVRESEEKKLAERRRNVLVLILRHLADNGYVEAYQRLSTECNISLNKVHGPAGHNAAHCVSATHLCNSPRPCRFNHKDSNMQLGGRNPAKATLLCCC